MKRISITLMMMMALASAHAQVAKWIVPPIYDNLTIGNNVDIVITDSVNSHILWSFNGRRMATITDDLFPYADGMAVTCKHGTAYITGIYDSYGRGIPVSGMQLGWGHPFFSNGLLLVHDGHNYGFMNNAGQVDNRRFAKAFPFANGYSSVFTFHDLRKQKSPYYVLLDDELNPVPLKWEGKTIATSDIEFISSVNDENVGIIVAKKKVFFFDGNTKALSPVFATPDETNTKFQAKLEGDINQCLINVGDTAMLLRTSCGRAGNVDIMMGSFMTPTEIIRNGESYVYKVKEQELRRFGSQLKKHLGPNGKIGLYLGDKEVMPPQFERVPLCFGDKAIIGVGDKEGVLRVYSDVSFSPSLNKEKPIAFRHKLFETTLRINLPPYISPGATSIEVTPESGIIIDKLTKQTNTTADGNLVQYDCQIPIPPTLADTAEIIQVPLQVSYAGLLSPVIYAKAKAWHYKYYTVDINERDATIKNGQLAFTFDISAERTGDDVIYPHTCTLKTDGLHFDIKKVSETRYKCTVDNLRMGTNKIIVQILEEGCPPSDYEFEIERVHEVQNKGTVTIRKKPTPPIHVLDI